MLSQQFIKNKRAQYTGLAVGIFVLLPPACLLSLAFMPVGQHQPLNFIHLLIYTTLLIALMFGLYAIMQLSEKTMEKKLKRIQIFCFIPVCTGGPLPLFSVVLTLSIGDYFGIFHLICTIIISAYILVWIREDNKNYGIDWIWGRNEQENDIEIENTNQKNPEEK